jgi:spermidine/putrescine transport system permease protein
LRSEHVEEGERGNGVGAGSDPGAHTRSSAGGPRYPAWLALPAIGWYGAFFLVPLGFIAAYSFQELEGFSDIAWTWNVENYRYLWDPLYGEVFVRTAGLALFGTAATLALGFPFAYWLARYARRRTLLLFLVILPFWTSFLIRTYAWLIIFDPEFPVFRWLDVNLLYSTQAVYVGVVYNYLPLMVLPLYAALERMDWTLVEAAQDLGDSAFRAFRRVTLPLVLPGLIAGCLLVFIPLTGEFLIPSILGGEKLFFVGNLIAQQFGEARDWPFGAAIAMVLIAGMTVALLFYARVLGRQEQFGG